MKVTEMAQDHKFILTNEVKNDARIPEAKDAYEVAAEAQAYIDASKTGSVAFLEKMFVRSILSRFKGVQSLRVLDVGTGPGWIPGLLAKARPTWSIDVVDASQTMLEHARKFARSQNAHINCALGYAEALPYASKSFDLIISHFAFHEFSDPLGALREMTRVAAPHGSLIIQDLLRPGPVMSVIGKVCSITYSERMKRQYVESLRAAYTADEIRKLASQAGLNTIQLNSVLGIYFQMIVRHL